MHKKLLVLPVDGRPVVCSQLKQLGQLAGWDIVLPPASMLGYYRKSANREALCDWMLEQSSSVDGFVLSLDTLIYGGLVASRISDETMTDLLNRAGFLHQLKELHPTKPIYGFLATMRISNNNINEEEKDYWNLYGELIWKWSYHSDKYDIHGEHADLQIAQEAQANVPAEIQADYLETRARNSEITETVLGFVKDSTIQRLILPQDDNAPYGFNIAETRALKTKINAINLHSEVKVYSGADEVAWTLTSHLISKLEQRLPRKVYLSWHHPEDADSVIPRYEDQPIGEAVINQLVAAGTVIVWDVESADLVLGIHTANQPQGDWALQKALEFDTPLNTSWMDMLLSWQEKGLPVAIADLAYANGGDPKFFDFMLNRLDPKSIVAYSAWNTTSNSLGTAAAQIQLSPPHDLPLAGLELFVLRLVDDAFYQAIYRQIIRQQINSSFLSLESTKSGFSQSANKWLRGHSIDFVHIRDVHFPWNRTFEIGFNCEVETNT